LGKRKVMPTKKKGRRTHIIKVYCAKCQTLLYKYQKAGLGSLIKCYKDRIAEDYTRGDLKCPKCGETFAREAVYHGKPANKIILGKVYVRPYIHTAPFSFFK
jgi:ribosomal protein S27E